MIDYFLLEMWINEYEYLDTDKIRVFQIAGMETVTIVLCLNFAPCHPYSRILLEYYKYFIISFILI